MISQDEFENETIQDENNQRVESPVNNKDENRSDEPSNVADSIKQKSKTRRFTPLVYGIIGGMIGAAVVYLAVPNFIEQKVQNVTIEDQGLENTKSTKSEGKKFSNETTQVVQDVKNAVVGVVNIQSNNMFAEEGEAGIGSGVIYKKQGDNAYVVTNNHVVEGATKLEVSLSDGRRIEAELLGTDIYTDLAVLKISSRFVKEVAKFGISGNTQVGEPAIAIGNPLDLKFSGTVTQGIISGVERTVDVDLDGNGSFDWEVEALQTDAAINPGNSGGALVNMNGEVIGINSMKINQTAVEAIGFAIPIDIAKPVIESLEKDGEVKRPYMGVQLRSVGELSQYHQQTTLKLPEDVKSGIVLIEVIADSPAQKAGLQMYDVIYEMDGISVDNVVDLRKALYKKKIGDEMDIKYYRDGIKKATKIVLTGAEY